MKLSLEEYSKIKAQQEEKIQTWLTKHFESFFHHPSSIVLIDELLHAIDYLRSANAPRRLDRLSWSQCLSQSKEWLLKLNKTHSKWIGEPETESDIKVVQKLNKFCWVQLLSEKAYIREGQLMGHCVASYSSRAESRIISLRDENNLPHCTIELTGTEVMQVKGKQNQMVVAKYHQIVREFIQAQDLKVESYDLWQYGWLLVDGKVIQETELPDEVVIKASVDVVLSKFARIPKKMKVELIEIRDHSDLDLSQWEIGLLKLTNCRRVILPEVIKDLVLSHSVVSTKSLVVDKLSLTKSTLLVEEKLSANNLKVKESYLQGQDLICKSYFNLMDSKVNFKVMNVDNFSSENFASLSFDSLSISHTFKVSTELSEEIVRKVNITNSSGVIFNNSFNQEFKWPNHWTEVYYLKLPPAVVSRIDFSSLKDVKQITLSQKLIIQGKENSSINVVSFFKEKERNPKFDYVSVIFE